MPLGQALWIYGRKPGVAHGVYANLTSRASDLGFDISKLKDAESSDKGAVARFREQVTSMKRRAFSGDESVDWQKAFGALFAQPAHVATCTCVSVSRAFCFLCMLSITSKL